MQTLFGDASGLGHPARGVRISGDVGLARPGEGEPVCVEEALRPFREEVADPGPATRLMLAPGALHALVPEEGGASLRWAGAPLTLNAIETGWIERLAEGATPAELGDGAEEFCRRLLRRGLLVAG